MNYANHLYKLRQNVVRKSRINGMQILLSNFKGTEQQKDIEKNGYLINDYFRVEQNRGAFASLRNVDRDLSKAFVYQLKACNLNCPYCYVDDANKNGKQDNNSRFFAIKDIVSVFDKEKRKEGIYNLRPSGGEPTIAVEQWIEILRELDRRGIGKEVYVQSDTNLTTGRFIESLEKKGEIEKNILSKIGEYENFRLLCSFKGTDIRSFCGAAGSSTDIYEDQMESLKKFVRAGIDCYPSVFSPNPSTLEEFMENGARIFGDGFYFKTWLIPLEPSHAERPRTKKNQEECYKKYAERFSRCEEIMQDIVWKKRHLEYKTVLRTGIKLKVKK